MSHIPTPVATSEGGTGASTAANARTNLGVTATGSDTTYAYRANNLSDLSSASSARSNLGLGAIATQNYTASTYSATLTPSGSGSITLSAAADTLAYTRVGRLVTVTGRLDVSAVSSPTGTTLSLPLPLAVASLSDESGTFGCQGGLYDSGGGVLNPFGVSGTEGASTATLWSLSVSIIDSSYKFYFSFSYFTD